MEELIQWGVATEPVAGEIVQGDSHLVQTLPDGIVFAVVDALGHGKEAFQVASIAMETTRTHIHLTLSEIIQKVHESLRGTRGAVMSVAFIRNDGALSWLGVGNIDGFIFRNGKSPSSPISLLVRAGMLGGSKAPPVQTTAQPLLHGDLLIIATDGIDQKFTRTEFGDRTPQDVSDSILKDHKIKTDDALVLAIRFNRKVSS